MVGDTIAIGIDLGTTNSSVAIYRNGAIEIVKKPGGVEYTPSVFGFDKSKNRIVGQRAYDALYGAQSDGDAQNFKPEVKRLIGTPETFYFSRAGISLNAEEISAEILKSLKQDIQRKYPEFDTGAAVITIPAAFSVLQCEATKRAGELAGFGQVVLLQEPIAAAISYGFSAGKDETWLVYDLGGGTFDVAIVLSKDGVLSVMGHGGDNFLGGKNIDSAIVDVLFLPALLSRYSLASLNRESKDQGGRFVRLKSLAERAKIDLSSYNTTTVEFTGLGEDDSGEIIEHTIEISVDQLNSAMSAVIDRTIEICRDTMAETGISPASISKVILVGGPTQSPYIRSRLANDLSIAIETGVDPITVVARGACIYALGQRRAPSETNPDAIGKHRATLNYQSLTAELEQVVAGRIEGLESGAKYFVQLQSADGEFTTDKMPLRSGKFVSTVELQKNRSNKFWLYLLNDAGQPFPIYPDSITITHGISVAAAPLPHSIGVSVLARPTQGNGQPAEIFDRLIEKGAVLPAKASRQYKTARLLAVGRSDNPLLIRVGEGESPISDRNTFVCSLGIKGTDLPHDLPEGTPIDLTVELNAFRELTVTAYISAIDLRLNARATFQDQSIEIGEMQNALEVELTRLDGLDSAIPEKDRERVRATVRSIDESLKSAGNDEDDKRKADKQLRDLKVLLDSVEQSGGISQLVEKFGAEADGAQKIIDSLRTDSGDKERLSLRLSEVRADAKRAAAAQDKVILAALIERVSEIAAQAIRLDPMAWLRYFQSFENGEQPMKDTPDIDRLMQQGRNAIAVDDLEALKQCCLKLGALVVSDQRSATIVRSGIMK